MALATVKIRKVEGHMGRSYTVKPRWYVDYIYPVMGNKRRGPFWSREDAEAERQRYLDMKEGRKEDHGNRVV